MFRCSQILFSDLVYENLDENKQIRTKCLPLFLDFVNSHFPVKKHRFFATMSMCVPFGRGCMGFVSSVVRLPTATRPYGLGDQP